MGWHVQSAFDEAAARGWSQEEFARRLGMNGATISRIKTGQIKKPSLEFRERLKRVFPLHDIDKLVRWVPDEQDQATEAEAKAS